MVRPADTSAREPERVHGTVTFRARRLPAPRRSTLSLTVRDKLLADAGDSDLWRQSRLRWLDSTIGLDDEVFPPYTPVTVEGHALPSLAGRCDWPTSACRQHHQQLHAKRGRHRRRAAGTAGGADAVGGRDGRRAAVGLAGRGPKTVADIGGRCLGADQQGAACRDCLPRQDGVRRLRQLQADLKAAEAADLKDIRLEIPLRREIATYMMGLGRKGGFRPDEWQWKWDVDRANNQLWIGDVNAGLSCKLKHDRGPLGPVQSPGNRVLPGLEQRRPGRLHGRGRAGDRVLIRAYTGPRHVAAGEELHFNFGLLITPVKTARQGPLAWRYFRHCSASPSTEVAPHAARRSSTSIRATPEPVHQLPVRTRRQTHAYVARGARPQLKVKLYYTVRELSNYAAEFWALRSLGHEVFLDGPGFRLADQFETTNRPPGRTRPAVPGFANTRYRLRARLAHAFRPRPLRRRHRHHRTLALAQLLPRGSQLADPQRRDRRPVPGRHRLRPRDHEARAQGDGPRRPGLPDRFPLRQQLPSRVRPEQLRQPVHGAFPYIDSLWFGEGFNYNESPDYWLVEISGIPFGLFGEMLQAAATLAGHDLRHDRSPQLRRRSACALETLGRVRHRPGADDRLLGARLSREDRPARDMLATAYVQSGEDAGVAGELGPTSRACRLKIDWKALGLDPQKAHLFAPAISGFQEAAFVGPGATRVPVMPARGWSLIIDEAPHNRTRAQNDQRLRQESEGSLFQDRFTASKNGSRRSRRAARGTETGLQ